MYQKIFVIASVLTLCACGAESNDSTFVSPTDTISSTATVRFSTVDDTLEVLETGPDAVSKVFEACNFSMSPIQGELTYDLVDANTLKLGSGTFSYKRALKSPEAKTGVDDRIFSVWGSPDKLTDGVTLALELEIKPELLTFRMSCTG